jgi:Na+/melibiose symporter-like transporter
MFVQPKEDVMTASTDRLLRRTLWGNAAFSVVSGATLAIFAGPFAKAAAHAPVTVLGIDLAIAFELLGLGVVAFGALCAWVASRETLPRGLARLIFLGDVAWVAGSVLVLALPATWTTAGVMGIVVLAVIVADVAILEYLGLRRLGSAT